MQLRKVIKRYIDEKGITASSLANKTGIPKATLLGWIAGRIPRDFEQLRTLARFLEMSLEELLFDEYAIQQPQILFTKSDKSGSGSFQLDDGRYRLLLEVKVEGYEKL